MNESDKTNIICFNSEIPGKLIKWKVRSGSRLSYGTILLLYELINGENGSKNVLKMKSKAEGTVEKLLLREGQTLEPGSDVLQLKGGACTHPVVMKDLCAECGADLRQLDDNEIAETSANASVSMIHSVPELRISEDQAKSLGKADQDRLLKARKLVLLVDLDQTLIHTTNEDVPVDMKGVFHFQLYGPRSPWYHTKLRPGTEEFLEKISKLYELHIFTFGARPYAHHIACLIDPHGKYFSHRILSRDECFSQSSKSGNLKALFPCGDSMVCIIDDREDVWNFAPNLVPVKPYHFFSGTGDINAPLGIERNDLRFKNIRKMEKNLAPLKDFINKPGELAKKDTSINMVNPTIQTKGDKDVIEDISSKMVHPSVEINEEMPINNEPSDNSKLEENKSFKAENMSTDTDNKSIQPVDKSIEPEDKSVEPEDKSIEPEDKSVEPEDKSVEPENKSVEPENKSVEPKNKSVEPENKSVEPENKSVEPENKSVEPENKSVEPENKSVEPENKSVEPENKSVELENKSVEPENKLVEPEGKSVEPEGKSVEPEGKSVEPEGKSVEPEGKSVEPEGKSVEPEGKSVEPEGKSVEPEGKSVEPEGKSVEPEETPVKSEDKSIESKHKPTEFEDKPTEFEDKPTKFEDKPTEFEDKPTELDKNPLEPVNKQTELEDKTKPNSESVNSTSISSRVLNKQIIRPNSTVLEADLYCNINGNNISDDILLDNENISKERGEFKTDDSMEVSSVNEIPEDDYLLYLEEVLTMIHKAFYDLYDQLRLDNDKDIPDLKMVIPYVRRKVLQNVNLVFSGVIPTNMDPDKSKLCILAKSLGANIHNDLVPPNAPGNGTTHLIAAKLGTMKVNKAKKMKGMHVVNPDWLWCCAERWERVDERLFPLTEEVSKNPFAKFKRKHLFHPQGPDAYRNDGSNVNDAHRNKISSLNSTKIDSDKDSNAFSSSYSPLLSFSTDEITKMGQEVDDACSEESENEAETEELGNTLKVELESESTSVESLSGGEFPRGWKKRKKSDIKEREMEDTLLKKEEFGGIIESEDEEIATKFARREIPYNSEQSNNSDSDEFNDSIGSVDEELAAAVEREFLN